MQRCAQLGLGPDEWRGLEGEPSWRPPGAAGRRERGHAVRIRHRCHRTRTATPARRTCSWPRGPGRASHIAPTAGRSAVVLLLQVSPRKLPPAPRKHGSTEVRSGVGGGRATILPQQGLLRNAWPKKCSCTPLSCLETTPKHAQTRPRPFGSASERAARTSLRGSPRRAVPLYTKQQPDNICPKCYSERGRQWPCACLAPCGGRAEERNDECGSDAATERRSDEGRGPSRARSPRTRGPPQWRRKCLVTMELTE